jgi:hypothetical protein
MSMKVSTAQGNRMAGSNMAHFPHFTRNFLAEKRPDNLTPGRDYLLQVFLIVDRSDSKRRLALRYIHVFGMEPLRGYEILA